MANEPLYNPNDGLTGRDGGPYLDQVQAIEAEKQRAKVEGREPDLDNPGVHAGIPLYTAAQMLDGVTVNSHPSQADRRNVDARRIFEGSVADEDTLLTATGESIPVDEVEEANKAVRKERGEEVPEETEVTEETPASEETPEEDPFKTL